MAERKKVKAVKSVKPKKASRAGATSGRKEVKSREARQAQGKIEKLAVLGIAGSQYLVGEGTELEVNRLPLEEGKREKVAALVLKPKITEGSVTYKLLEHKKGPKLTIMKFRAKSRYRRKQGFRASLSRILVEEIKVKG